MYRERGCNEWLGSVCINFHNFLCNNPSHSLMSFSRSLTGHTHIFVECYETMMTTTTTIILFYLSLSPHNHIIIIFFLFLIVVIPTTTTRHFGLLAWLVYVCFKSNDDLLCWSVFFFSGHFSTVLCMVRLARTKELWFIYSRARGINGMNSVKKLIFLFTAIINFQWNFNYENCMHIAIIIFLSSYFFMWFISERKSS